MLQEKSGEDLPQQVGLSHAPPHARKTRSAPEGCFSVLHVCSAEKYTPPVTVIPSRRHTLDLTFKVL